MAQHKVPKNLDAALRNTDVEDMNDILANDEPIHGHHSNEESDEALDLMNKLLESLELRQLRKTTRIVHEE